MDRAVVAPDRGASRCAEEKFWVTEIEKSSPDPRCFHEVLENRGSNDRD
jgi:hypothetical protein